LTTLDKMKATAANQSKYWIYISKSHLSLHSWQIVQQKHITAILYNTKVADTLLLLWWARVTERYISYTRRQQLWQMVSAENIY